MVGGSVTSRTGSDARGAYEDRGADGDVAALHARTTAIISS